MQTPYYIVYEQRLRHNLDIITRLAQQADVQFIMAFKANALWGTFPIFRQYGIASTASSVNEMRLANETLHCRAHTYCPAYTDNTIRTFLRGSSHITFNSINQYLHFKPYVDRHNRLNKQQPVACGLRINPMVSVVDTGIYDPSAPGSRFGITAEHLRDVAMLPQGISGLHFHALCEGSADNLQTILTAVEQQFGHLLPHIKWLNMGGGHLVTHANYNRQQFINLINDFHRRHPNLQCILEPGSAFTWQTGNLVATIIDIVENSGIQTAIIDASFACHMPDCLEMPYKPVITEALPDLSPDKPTYRIGGNSCLSGDFAGPWSFDKPLQIGQRLTFEDMNHYTTVKTNMFNGIQHPDILLQHADGTIRLLRHFTYADYKHRMS